MPIPLTKTTGPQTLPKCDPIPKVGLGKSDRSTNDYIPTLDGWRAVSIGAVLLYHDKLNELGPITTKWFYDNGYLGVDIFFAISGILICTRLLDEEEKTGRIGFKSFYIRRAFRILPAAVLFLAVLGLATIAIRLPVSWPEIVASLIFIRNYKHGFPHFQRSHPYYTDHFWSLSVEEHFYLLLPALLVFGPKKWRAPTLIVLAVILEVFRYFNGVIAVTSWSTHFQLDKLLVPAAIAVLLRQPPMRHRIVQLARFWPVLACGLITLVSLRTMRKLEPIAIAWITPLIILGTVSNPTGYFARILEWPPFRFLGRRSYSIYLWQQLFFVSHFGYTFAPIAVFQRWPLCIVMTLGCAALSYHFIERRFIRIGHRLALA